MLDLTRNVTTQSKPFALGDVALLAAVCGATVVLDYALLSMIPQQGEAISFAQYLFYGLVIGQVACIGVATGRWLRQLRGRWLLLWWSLFLVNILLQTLDTPGSSAFAIALHSSQLSMLCVWCLLGSAPTSSRLIVGLVFGPMLYSWASEGRGMGCGWNLILMFQVALTSAICALGRWRGYRLTHDLQMEARGNERFQFSVRNLLVLLLAAGPGILIVSRLKWRGLLQLDSGELGVAAMIGFAWMVAASGAIFLTLISSRGFGKLRHWLIWVGLLLVLPWSVGACISWGAEFRAAQMGPLVWRQEANVSFISWFGEQWETWLVFSNLYLVALLIFFRADGQRIKRGVR